MNKTKIDWQNPREGWKLDYTWSPIIGCKSGCSYCVAKQWNDRYKWVKNWEEPEFSEKRFESIKKLKNKPPSTIFVQFLGDLFGSWIKPVAGTMRIIDECAYYEKHRFLFLTKYPERYLEFSFPDNCWLGVTITGEEKQWTNSFLDGYKSMINKTNNKFLSIEPLLGNRIPYNSLCEFDLVIVGAQTGVKEPVKPQPNVINNIKNTGHDNIYWKKNIRRCL